MNANAAVNPVAPYPHALNARVLQLQEEVEGTYKVTKDEIEFTDEKGTNADKAAGPGTYKWKLDGDKVTFTKVKDKSKGRSEALTAGAWERKKE